MTNMLLFFYFDFIVAYSVMNILQKKYMRLEAKFLGDYKDLPINLSVIPVPFFFLFCLIFNFCGDCTFKKQSSWNSLGFYLSQSLNLFSPPPVLCRHVHVVISRPSSVRCEYSYHYYVY